MAYEFIDDTPKGRYEFIDEPVKPKTTVMQDIKQGAGNAGAGLVRGAGSIGSTILAAADLASPFGLAKDLIQGKSVLDRVKQIGKDDTERRQAMTTGLQEMGADPNSLLFRGFKLGGEVAGTAGMGGLIANTTRAVAPSIAASRFGAPIVDAIASSGMRASGLTGLKSVAPRMLGGAVTGGASAGLIDPETAGTGAAFSAALPPALMALGKVGNIAGSLVKPFTSKGQEQLANKILFNAGGGTLNTSGNEIVRGSIPTLAETANNANISGLQRVARSINPQPFVEREAANAAARNALFDDVAGDSAKKAFFTADRAAASNQLYGDALREGINPKAYTTVVQREIKNLLFKPAIIKAQKEAQELAANEGLDLTNKSGSLQGLHYTKMALDKQIGKALSQQGGENEARILLGVKDKLMGVMEKTSPKYAEANATFAEMSKPINQMEFLQKLNLTDQYGNITLNKIQNALKTIERKTDASGVNDAKSLTSEQIGALMSIRDDLLRQSKTQLGRASGSDTFQNIATNNIIESILPGGAGVMAKNYLGTPFAQVGQLFYNKPNEAIRMKMIDNILNPSRIIPPAANGGGLLGLNPRIEQFGYQAAPALLNR